MDEPNLNKNYYVLRLENANTIEEIEEINNEFKNEIDSLKKNKEKYNQQVYEEISNLINEKKLGRTRRTAHGGKKTRKLNKHKSRKNKRKSRKNKRKSRKNK